MVAGLFAAYWEPGQSIYGLTKHRLGLHVPTMHGCVRWHPSTIRNILHNPVTTGHVSMGRTRASVARHRRSPRVPLSRTGNRRIMTPPTEWTLITQIPSIVTQEPFAAVQAPLAHNQQCARRNHTAHAYLLRALVSCGGCQRACLARTNGGNA